MINSKIYRCPNHAINYVTWKDFVRHQETECKQWLERKNVCTFLKNGQACGEHFRHTSTLILHYFKIHDVYACAFCYGIFMTAKELEEHEHSSELNVRLSKYRSVCLLQF